MAAILIFSTWCALVIYSCVTSPNKYWWPPYWFSARGAHWWSSNVLPISPNKYWWPPSWFSVHGALWWSAVVLPLLTNIDGHHLDFNVGAFWWISVVLPLLTNTDGRHLDFKHIGAFWWTAVFYTLLTNIDGRHLDFNVGAFWWILVVFPCWWPSSWFLARGALWYAAVVSTWVCTAWPTSWSGSSSPAASFPSSVSWVSMRRSYWVRRGQVLGLDEAKLLMGEAWLLIRVRRD